MGISGTPEEEMGIRSCDGKGDSGNCSSSDFSHILKDCMILLGGFKTLSSCQLRHGGTADPSVHSWALQQSEPQTDRKQFPSFCKVSFLPVYIPELFHAVSERKPRTVSMHGWRLQGRWACGSPQLHRCKL